jgi:glutamine amidotransferase
MTSPQVTIVDYGLGNLLSVRRGFEYCGAKVSIASDPRVILKSSHLVLPGVGAFPNAMSLLRKHNLIDAVREFGQSGKPLLAICLGMQLLMDESDEFTTTTGLGLISGRVIPVPSTDNSGKKVKVPHIGWSPILPAHRGKGWDGTVLADNSPGDSVYFVHSFMVALANRNEELAYANYGENRVSAVISKEQIIGCQFHPEKSGELGLKIMQRFCHD